MASSVSYVQMAVKTCEIHQTEEIDMFCKTCELPYCVECIQENHKEHSWCRLSKIITDKLRDAPRKCEELRNDVIPKITGYIQDVCFSRDKMTQEKEEKINRIKSQKTKMFAVIENSVKRMVESLENNHDESSKILDEVEDTLKKVKDEIEEFAETLEERSSYTSEFAIWEIHRDLDLKISQIKKPDIENSLTHTQYIEGEINTKVLEVLLGTLQHGDQNDPELNVILTYGTSQPNITEVSTFDKGDKPIYTVVPVSNTTAWLRSSASQSVELYTTEGNIKKHQDVQSITDLTILGNGDMVYTDGVSRDIKRITQTGHTSTVADTSPLYPTGICTTLSGDLLVTLVDDITYKTDQNSQRLVKQITLASGQVKKTYQYDNDENKQQLFTVPWRVTQNFNTDVCVVDCTSESSGQVYILYESGEVKYKYLGQKLQHQFLPSDVVCDPNCNILISDVNNHMIHLLHHSGQFIRYLNSETKGLQYPYSLGLYKQQVWVGNFDGKVTVYKYDF